MYAQQTPKVLANKLPTSPQKHYGLLQRGGIAFNSPRQIAFK